MVEFSRPLLNRLILRRRPQFQKVFASFKRGECGAEVIDKEKNSLLHLAVLENQLDYVEELLDCGLSLEMKNHWEMRPIDLAYFLGRKSFFSFLERKRDCFPITIFRNLDQKKHQLSLEEFESKLEIEYIQTLEFEHPDYLKWAVKKSQKRLKRNRYRKMNRWILALHKKAILSPRHDHIYVRYIDPSIGYGVFANRDIPALTYIGEYTGVVTLRKKKRTRLNDYVFGYMTGPKDSPFIIDAQKRGNFTRFINHSDDPNLSSRWVVIKGVTHIIFFSNQFIPDGRQLTYDYGKYYWRSRSSPFAI